MTQLHREDIEANFAAAKADWEFRNHGQTFPLVMDWREIDDGALEEIEVARRCGPYA